MNAPVIWIVLPLITACILWLLRSRHTFVILSASIFCLIMALLAWILPIDMLIRMGNQTIEISSILLFFGRKFVITENDKSFLILIYIISSFWFLGGLIAGIYRRFIPIALAITAIFVAALSVEPFLYAALIIEVAVLISIPMLVSPERPVGQGILRYLIFQTLALPVMLLAGWFSTSVNANPADTRMLNQTVLLLALGFIFWLAVFPFYTWVPLLSGETHPYIAGFILNLLPVVVLLLAIDFFNAYTWLREYQLLIPALRIIGTLMVVTGGLFAAFQQNISRLFGYAVIIENGYSILALSLGNQTGTALLVSSILPRILGLGVWSVAMSILDRGRRSLSFNEVKGLLRRMPLASSAIILSIFSAAGLPLLAGFPCRQVLMISIALHSHLLVLWVIIGNLGLLLSGFRVLVVLAGTKTTGWSIRESWLQSVMLIGGIAALVLIGLIPGIFSTGMMGMIEAFRFLK